MVVVKLSRSARRDLIDHFDYLEEEAGLRVAERFLDEAEASFALLSTQPAMGAPLTLRSAELAGLRKWRIDGFDSVLIFYKPLPDGIAIVRVLHASQDWWGLLGLTG